MRRLAIAVVATALMLPAAANADFTATHITTPASPAYVTFDPAHPGTMRVEGTASGDGSQVDLRCYWGSKSSLVSSGVDVSNGSFGIDVQLTKAMMTGLGNPEPYCVLRAVPTTTMPDAAPGTASAWDGPDIGWGWHVDIAVGTGHDPTPAAALADLYASRAQSGATVEFDSAVTCGLCGANLVDPVTHAFSKPIWQGSAYFPSDPKRNPGRASIEIDGQPAYAAGTAYWGGAADLANNPGFPSLTWSDHVDPLTGDLSFDEHAAFSRCAPDSGVFPATDVSCASFGGAGVRLDREIRQYDDGRQVKVVDHWKSTDGQAHQLDAVYVDTEASLNAATAGHEANWNFTWTGDGFKTYPSGTFIQAPPAAPVSVLLKTDATTPAAGDGVNPIGALTYGSQPSEIWLRRASSPQSLTGEWQSRYERTIPAGGEVTIAMAYSHAYSLDQVQAMATAAEAALTPPPADRMPPPADATPPGAQTPVAGDPAPATVTPIQKPAALTCVVPKLRGKTLAAAKRLLKRAHCKLGKVARKPSTTVKAGRVIATRVKARSRHPAGTRVRVTIARK